MKNKNLFYQLILISIFLVSLANSTKPVVGYELGIPEQAIGVEGVSHVKTYDKNEWDDHLGSGAMDPDELFNSKNADKVGAKGKSRVIGWEEGENNIDFFKEFILKAETEIEGVPEVENFLDSLDYLNDTLNGFAIFNSETPLIIAFIVAIDSKSIFNNAEPGSIKDDVFQNMWLAFNKCLDYSFDAAYVENKYNEKFDGTILLRDYWKSTTGEFNENPDKKNDPVPIFKEPNAWYDNYELLDDLRDELLTESGKVIEACEELEASIAVVKTLEFDNWTLINSSLETALGLADIDIPAISEGGDDLSYLLINAALNPSGEAPLQDGTQGLLYLETIIKENLPEKFGYLYNLFLNGLPTYKPADKYLKEVLNDFDIDEEDVEMYIPGLNPNLKVRGDIELNGRVITIKFRYPEGTVDPDDPDNELEDFEVQITYSEAGFQESLVFKDGDNIFYETDGLIFETVIFGYPLYTIMTVGTLGSSISIISLIYAISKKRRNKV